MLAQDYQLDDKFNEVGERDRNLSAGNKHCQWPSCADGYGSNSTSALFDRWRPLL